MRVHPRACGGNLTAFGTKSVLDGPSPRVRGKRFQSSSRLMRERSIPARAGETATNPRTRSRRWVHPRACGGNPSLARFLGGGEGPSPRVRGKLKPADRRIESRGSIPARAGETRRSSRPGSCRRVHPRACGGNRILNLNQFADGGPSPRVRGKQDVGRPAVRRIRSIPARAGETCVGCHNTGERRVHPRACGGNGSRAVSAALESGPSPRVRGKQRLLDLPEVGAGSIPARAGETGEHQDWSIWKPVHPRACGGNGGGLYSSTWSRGPSPRVRGKRLDPRLPRRRQGSIPARAGETSTWTRPHG